MQNIQTWSPPAAYDPTNPNQQPLQFYSPQDMGYRSRYWDEQPTTVQNLMGIMPDNSYAQVGIVAGLAAAVYFAAKHFGLGSKEMRGPRLRRHRR